MTTCFWQKNKTKQNKTKQIETKTKKENKTKQNKRKQNKTKNTFRAYRLKLLHRNFFWSHHILWIYLKKYLILCLHVNSYTYMIWSVNTLHMIQQCICHDLWKRGKHGWRQFWYESKPYYVLDSFLKEKGSIEFDLVIRVKFWSYKMSEVSQVYFYTLNSKKYLWNFKLYQCTFLWKKWIILFYWMNEINV